MTVSSLELSSGVFNQVFAIKLLCLDDGEDWSLLPSVSWGNRPSPIRCCRSPPTLLICTAKAGQLAPESFYKDSPRVARLIGRNLPPDRLFLFFLNPLYSPALRNGTTCIGPVTPDTIDLWLTP